MYGFRGFPRMGRKRDKKLVSLVFPCSQERYSEDLGTESGNVCSYWMTFPADVWTSRTCTLLWVVLRSTWRYKYRCCAAPLLRLFFDNEPSTGLPSALIASSSELGDAGYIFENHCCSLSSHGSSPLHLSADVMSLPILHAPC